MMRVLNPYWRVPRGNGIGGEGIVIRIAYLAGWIMLASAGAMLALCGTQSRQAASENPGIPEHSRPERSRVHASGADGIDSNPASPLVKQAMAFALYLKPPAPPVLKEAPRSKAGAQPLPKPPAAVAPRFLLLSTSCFRSNPEKSLALVAEPGKGGYWVRQGEHVGHLVVENIKDGAIVCRDGNQLREVAVAMKETVPLARPKSGAPLAMENGGPAIESLSVLQMKERGIAVPGAQQTANEGVH